MLPNELILKNTAKTQVGDIKKQQNTPLLIQVTGRIRYPNMMSCQVMPCRSPLNVMRFDVFASVKAHLDLIHFPHSFSWRHSLLEQLDFAELLFIQSFSRQGLSNAVEVACGAAFNLAMCADGAVYSWGVGELTRTIDHPVLFAFLADMIIFPTVVAVP